MALAGYAAAVRGATLCCVTEVRLSVPRFAQSAWSKCWSLENDDLHGGESPRGSASTGWTGDPREAGH